MKINNFRDEYFYLSNFYSTSVLYKGIVCQTAADLAELQIDLSITNDLEGESVC